MLTMEKEKVQQDEAVRDSYERAFGAGELDAFRRFVSKLCDSDEWTEEKLSSLQILLVNDGPLAVEEMRERLNLGSVSDQAIIDTTTTFKDGGDGSGLGLRLDRETTRLVGKSAVTGLLDRFGILCTAVRKMTATGDLANMARIGNELKALTVTESDACTVLYRNQKIRGVMSKGYVRFRQDDLVEDLIQTLRDRIGLEPVFTGATFSHTRTVAQWNFPDAADEIEKIYRAALTPSVILQTGDTANNAVRVMAMLDNPDYRIYAGSVELKHYGSADRETFRNLVSQIYAKFQGAASCLEELRKIMLHYPVNAFHNIAGQLAKDFGLKREYANEAEEYLLLMYGDTELQADEVFLNLQEVLHRMRRNGSAESTVLRIEEELYRMMLEPSRIKGYDSPLKDSSPF